MNAKTNGLIEELLAELQRATDDSRLSQADTLVALQEIDHGIAALVDRLDVLIEKMTEVAR